MSHMHKSGGPADTVTQRAVIFIWCFWFHYYLCSRLCLGEEMWDMSIWNPRPVSHAYWRHQPEWWFTITHKYVSCCRHGYAVVQIHQLLTVLEESYIFMMCRTVCLTAIKLAPVGRGRVHWNTRQPRRKNSRPSSQRLLDRKYEPVINQCCSSVGSQSSKSLWRVVWSSLLNC